MEIRGIRGIRGSSGSERIFRPPVTFPTSGCFHGINNTTSMKALTSSLVLLTLSVAAVANLVGAEAAYAVLAAAGVLAIAINDYSDRPVLN